MPREPRAPFVSHGAERLFGLDVLRATAGGLVVVAHALLILLPVFPQLRFAVRFGDVGVDIFFALSGYLIGGLLWRLRDRLGQEKILVGFWLRRWIRTLPNYFLFLVVNLVVVTVILNLSLPDGGRTVLRYSFFLQNLTHAPTWFFPESWTLSVEEWFYLALPLWLWGLRRCGIQFSAAMISGVALLILVPLTIRFLRAPVLSWSMDMRHAAVHRFDAIALGTLAASIQVLLPQLWQKLRLPGLVFGVVLVTASNLATFQVRSAGTTAVALIFSAQALGCALLLPWAASVARHRNLRLQAAVGALAAWSYSLYLCNLPLMNLLAGSGMTRQPLPQRFLAVALFLISSLLISRLVYQRFERPILKLRDRLAWCQAAR